MDYVKLFYFLSQVQCNVFEGATGEVALTSAGGLRELPGGRIENAALVLSENLLSSIFSSYPFYTCFI